ncbi:exported hypothetical protein [Cupriavidus taiwanensis]|nr:exported hypothetical protein [Cupriavidus taiwanensis]
MYNKLSAGLMPCALSCPLAAAPDQPRRAAQAAAIPPWRDPGPGTRLRAASAARPTALAHVPSSPGPLLHHREPPARPARHGRARGRVRRPLQRRQVHRDQHPVQPEAAGVLVAHARAHPAHQLFLGGAGQGARPACVPGRPARLRLCRGLGLGQVPLAGPAERLRADPPAARRPDPDDGCAPAVHRTRLPDGRVVPAHRTTDPRAADQGRQAHQQRERQGAARDPQDAARLCRAAGNAGADDGAAVLQPQAPRHRRSAGRDRRLAEPARSAEGGARARRRERRSTRFRSGRLIPNGARKKKPRREQRGQTFPPVRRVPAQGGVAGDTAPRSAQRKVSASMMAGTHKSLVFLRPAA